jgi:hypothetical protein
MQLISATSYQNGVVGLYHRASDATAPNPADRSELLAANSSAMRAVYHAAAARRGCSPSAVWSAGADADQRETRRRRSGSPRRGE